MCPDKSRYMQVASNTIMVWVGRLTLLLATSVGLFGCDGTEDLPVCPILEDDTHTFSTIFTDANSTAVARFEFQQSIRTYDDTGECERPSADVNDTRVIVTNLTSCTLDIDFSLSIFEGREGWTELGTSKVRAQAAEDLGVIHRGGTVRVDFAQILLTGSVTRSECT